MRATIAILLANIIVEIRGSGEMVGEAVRLREEGQEEGRPWFYTNPSKGMVSSMCWMDRVQTRRRLSGDGQPLHIDRTCLRLLVPY